METNDPTFQEVLVEPFLNTFSSPSWSKGALRLKMVETKNTVQRIELEGEDGQNSMVDVTTFSFAAHSSTFSPDVRAHQSFLTEWQRTHEGVIVGIAWVFS